MQRVGTSSGLRWARALLGALGVLASNCGGSVATTRDGTGAAPSVDGGDQIGSGGRGSGGVSSDSGVTSAGDGGATVGTGGMDGSVGTGGTSEVDASSWGVGPWWADGGLGIDAGFDGGAALVRACEHRFEAQYGARCSGPVLPDRELFRLSRLFLRVCVDSALPGDGRTAARLETCAADLEANACQGQLGRPSSCDIRGTLAAGAPCSDDAQCESGSCFKDVLCNPEGCNPVPTCGTCEPSATLGEDCHTAYCGLHEVCDTMTMSAAGVYQCIAAVDGDAGAPCDNLGSRCKPGLYCDLQTSRCAQLGGLGAQCGDIWSVGCKPPLICEGTPGVCQSPRAAGAACLFDGECASGLACAYGVCTAVTWANPGEHCDEQATLCRVGTCPKTADTCPSVIRDGQPCDPMNDPLMQKTCDTFSECINGVCAPHGSVVCK